MATETQMEKLNPPAATTAQWADRFSALWTQGKIRWATLEPAQRMRMMIAAGLLLSLLAGLLWYTLRTDWRVLYANLDGEDARQAGQILTQAQIPFDVTDNGAGIRVPAAQLDKARLATAAKGGMKSGRIGFEIFDKPNWVGSEFDEQVNYQRALEGELEHTVGSLSDVEFARVHLVMPHDSLFRDQERPAKASVVLKLKHRTLSDGEPEAIRNLVASAVDGLTPDRVALVDAEGHLPLGPKSASAALLSEEEALEEKLVATLEPVTGAGNVRVSVTLEENPTAKDETDESYDPNQSATLSIQRSEQTSGPQPIPAGVPGTASNAPNSQSVPVYPQLTTPPQSTKTESGTYGVSKTIRHLTENAGHLRRMTAAIVVNDRLLQATSKGQTAQWQSRSTQEISELTALAQAAVGYNASRGDLLTVQNLAFDTNRAAPPASAFSKGITAVEKSPQLLKYAALLIGILTVIFFGIRPAFKHAKAALHTPNALPSLPNMALTEPNPIAESNVNEADPQRQRALEIFEQVTGQLKREPSQSSRLLQSWIHSD